MDLPYSHLRLLKPNPREAEICSRIVKGTSGIVARLLNKRFSLPISLVLARRGVSPNSITFFNLGAGLLSAALVSLGTRSGLVWGGILFQVVSILDGVDGEVAKLNNRSSRLGQWLDTFGDNLSYFTFLFGLTWGGYRMTGDPLILTLGKWALVSSLLFFLLMLLFIRGHSDSGSLTTFEKEVVRNSEDRFLSRLVVSSRYLVKKDFFSLIFCLLAILNLSDLLLALTAIGTTIGSAVALILHLRRRLVAI